MQSILLPSRVRETDTGNLQTECKRTKLAKLAYIIIARTSLGNGSQITSCRATHN